MIKKICFSLIFVSIIASNAFGMSLTTPQPSIKAVKRSYQEAVVQLKKMEQLNTDLYAKIAPVITKIIDSEPFKAKMNESIQAQYNEITEQGASFVTIKQESSLADFFPNTSAMGGYKYMNELYKLMAKKAYSELLWQKLSNKEREAFPESEVPAESTTLEEVTFPKFDTQQEYV